MGIDTQDIYPRPPRLWVVRERVRERESQSEHSKRETECKSESESENESAQMCEYVRSKEQGTRACTRARNPGFSLFLIFFTHTECLV